MVLSFRDLYPHSLECILSVIWSISTSLAFDPIFGAKAGGGGCENLTSMQIWLWNDPILTFEDRYLIGFTILYIQYDCMSNNYLW